LNKIKFVKKDILHLDKANFKIDLLKLAFPPTTTYGDQQSYYYEIFLIL